MTGVGTADPIGATIGAVFHELLGEEQARAALALWRELSEAGSGTPSPVRFMVAAQKRLGFSHELKKRLTHRITGAADGTSTDELFASGTGWAAPAGSSAAAPARRAGGAVGGTAGGATAAASPSVPAARGGAEASGGSDLQVIARFVVHRLQGQLGWSRDELFGTLPPRSAAGARDLLDGAATLPEREQLRLASLLLDALYEALCDVFGPVRSDQFLAQVVRQAEMLPEADRFPPRQLL